MSEKNGDMAERVVLARKDAGFKSQKAIAEAMGMTRDAYAWYETTRPIPTERITEFCRLTGVSEGWLLTGRGPMKSNSLYDLLDEAHRQFKERGNDLAAKMIETLKDEEK